MKKFLPLIAGLFIVNAHADHVTVTTKLTSVNQCRVNHTCDQQASHDIEIINDTDQNHFYGYSYSVCLVNKCESIGNVIYVNAHTRWNNHHDTVGHFLFDDSVKNADLMSETEVHGTETHITQDKRVIEIR